ncbi:acyloxyacyl hydrolase [Ohtaekwangia sp.]|uniref:acyloxyacyl hydrolase n=1 Tax=Ohtaekwangia sp. TaxID=2066019 RepID=UPI002FDD98DB
MRGIVFGILLFLQVSVAAAQNWFFNAADRHSGDSLPRYSFVQLRYQLSRLTDTKTPGLRYIEENPIQSVDLRYGFFGYGRKKWQQLHHYPMYGVGISKFWFCPVKNIVGNPFTTYLFFNEPFLQTKRSSLHYDFSIGLSYNWKAYNTYANPEQKAIGSSINVMIGFSLQYELRITDRFDLIAGPSIDHFSNGRTRSPNRGLNLYGLQASARYKIGPRKRKDLPRIFEQITYTIDPYKPMYEFYVVGSGGIVTTFRDMDHPDIYFWAASMSLDAARHYGYTGKYGIGFDWFYDGSLKEQFEERYKGDVPARLLFWPGVHISHEYLVHRWTFITQAGINLKKTGDKGIWYGRIALRYDVSKSIFLRAGLRIYDSFISDFIECGIGYSIYTHRE